MLKTPRDDIRGRMEMGMETETVYIVEVIEYNIPSWVLHMLSCYALNGDYTMEKSPLNSQKKGKINYDKFAIMKEK